MNDNYFHIKFDLLFNDGSTQSIDIDSNIPNKLNHLSSKIFEMYTKHNIRNNKFEEEINSLKEDMNEESKNFDRNREIAYFVMSYLYERGKFNKEILDSANVLLERTYYNDENIESRCHRDTFTSNRFSSYIFWKIADGIDLVRISNITVKLDNVYKHNSFNYKIKSITGPDIKFCCKFMDARFLLYNMYSIPSLRKKMIIKYAGKSYFEYLKRDSRNVLEYFWRFTKYRILGR